MKLFQAKSLVVAAVIGLTLVGPASSAINHTTLKTQILLGSFGSKWSYDASDVNSTTGQYYLTDRNAKSVDAVDVKTNAILYRIPGFTGFKGKPEISGPNGIAQIPGTQTGFVSDVNSVKMVDFAKHEITSSIAIPNAAGNRLDGGCYDSVDKIADFQAADDDTPATYFISATSQKIVASLKIPGGGLEGCVYEPQTKSFYLSVPSTKANPGGEIDVFNAADIVAGTAKTSKIYPLTGCEPQGVALGPVLSGKPQLAIACDLTEDGKPGDPIVTLVMNVVDGSVTTISQTGAGDQIAYNSKTNKYYLAGRNWFPSGKNAVGPKLSVLGIIDGGTDSTPPAFVENVPTCAPSASGGCKSGAHSVASDPVSGRTFVPVGTPGASVVNVYSE